MVALSMNVTKKRWNPGDRVRAKNYTIMTGTVRMVDTKRAVVDWDEPTDIPRVQRHDDLLYTAFPKNVAIHTRNNRLASLKQTIRERSSNNVGRHALVVSGLSALLFIAYHFLV